MPDSWVCSCVCEEEGADGGGTCCALQTCVVTTAITTARTACVPLMDRELDFISFCMAVIIVIFPREFRVSVQRNDTFM